jgi:hypothetical protein
MTSKVYLMSEETEEQRAEAMSSPLLSFKQERH